MSDRKYRHRGYQDSGDRPAPSGGPRAPRKEGPRGRGLGRPTATVFRCAVCGQSLEVGSLQHDSACRKCGADLHTCTHCAHFDSSAPNECRKPVTERVASKAKRNHCDLFTPRTTRERGPESSDTPSSAKDAFDALFDF